MFRNLYIILFFAISQFAVSQNWASCGQGFIWNVQGIYSDTVSNKLYVSGFGEYVDGIKANSVASWDGTKWDTLGHGAAGTSQNFLVRYKNKLYLLNNDYICAWDFATQTWDSVPGGKISTNGQIRSWCLDQNNDLLVAGEFTSIGSQAIRNIAKFDGTNFYAIGNPSTSVFLNTVGVYQNEIYIGGNFGGDTIRSGIAKWDGSQWVGVKNGFRGGGPPEVWDLKVYNNRLIAAGFWYGTTDKYMPSIAAWDGVNWNGLGAGIFYDTNPWGAIGQIQVHKNKLYVFGSFNRAGDIVVQNVAIWNDTNWCRINANFISPVFLGTFFRDTLYLPNQYVIDSDSTRMLGYYIGTNYMGTCGAAVGINEIKISDNIKIYPNPATSVINIYDEQNDLRNTTIQISNTLGETIISIPFSNEIDISQLSPGIYFISIQAINNRKTIKIIKQ